MPYGVRRAAERDAATNRQGQTPVVQFINFDLIRLLLRRVIMEQSGSGWIRRTQASEHPRASSRSSGPRRQPPALSIN